MKQPSVTTTKSPERDIHIALNVICPGRHTRSLKVHVENSKSFLTLLCIFSISLCYHLSSMGHQIHVIEY